MNDSYWKAQVSLGILPIGGITALFPTHLSAPYKSRLSWWGALKEVVIYPVRMKGIALRVRDKTTRRGRERMNMSKRPRFSWTGGGPGGDVKEVSYSDSSNRKAGNLQQDDGYWT